MIALSVKRCEAGIVRRVLRGGHCEELTGCRRRGGAAATSGSWEDALGPAFPGRALHRRRPPRKRAGRWMARSWMRDATPQPGLVGLATEAYPRPVPPRAVTLRTAG